MPDEMTREDIITIAREAAQAVAQQAAEQLSQQIAEQTAQAASQAIAKVLQSQTQTAGATMLAGRQELGDIGDTERLTLNNLDNNEMLFANIKRTYDEYQHESLESIKRNRSYVDKVLSDAQSHDNRVRQIAEQALQNAVETANIVGKQAVRHGDLAIDREWNVDEQGYTAESVIGTLEPTLKSVVAKILADMAAEKGE